ncbi:S8 family serine peptidase [Rhizobium sp. 25PS6]|uniref:S8 family serine peptidase n=1 Tax=Rhizobium TaxID=379 RepID=UPI00144109F1|nr:MULTISPECIES: S8 family serine peptidase [Rhizobium]MBY3181844.1 S8 family serine peptidase [Rhizobium laguerreae]MBY3221499.1 S8 family serine peptidase [Rhizobium laguerreae]MDU0305929.1 S8 family serine peptidase [Rhizobium sp. 10PS4]MDU0359002.1 S8 family serine peptidase [Rhizobium sp. 25PS6]NKM23407.1 S8 family serine peptidase [Rhizobium laguerreae]
MANFDILRAVSEASQGDDQALHPGIVRFELELKNVSSAADLRKRLASLLQRDTFSLVPLGSLLPTFYVLQFPGVSRTIAPDRLFAIADDLVEALDLVSCSPDIGSTLYAEPDARALRGNTPESVALDAFCWSQAATPSDHQWSVKAVKAPQAWAMSPKKGEGVLVAQPDTGVASHPDLDLEALRFDLAADIIGGDTDPTDPLDPTFANPGHGTATGSVVISRVGGGMVGSAPAASLVPIRCTTDVKIFDGTPIAAAILHAVKIKADVITMSLGGIYSRSIAAAVGVAIDAGLIIMAAAGNCVSFVVYPASDDRVIGVAGVDVNDKPWKGTSAGPSVTISAPAENVYVARRTPIDGGAGIVSGGQGTSFAVATTAGVAALWIAHFGRTKVRAEAKRRGVSVQELFRSALTSTARRPSRWNSWLHGAGIVDAEALLRLSLTKIPNKVDTPIAPESVPDAPTSMTVSQVFAEAQANAENGTNWARIGSEATFLAADAWRRSDAGRSVLLESAARPTPSPGLVAHAPASLRRSLKVANEAPHLVSPIPPPAPLRRQTLAMIAPTQPGRESTAESVRASLSGTGMRDLQDQIERALNEIEASSGTTLEASAARRDVLNRTESVVRSLITGGEAALSIEGRIVMESLVRLKGRPAFKVNDGAISKSQAEITDWAPALFAAEEYLPALCATVGRIDLNGEHVGTGFIAGPGLVITNRHVAEAIADVVPGNGGDRWFLRENVTINFDDRGRGNEKRFKVREIVSAGLSQIGEKVDFAHLDMAILDVETENMTGKLPKPIGLITDFNEAASKQDIAVIGYPARPDLAALDDPSGVETSETIGRRLAMIFGLDYGRKYFSPGTIVQAAGTLGGDGRNWILTHDATTLAGSSGSGVLRFSDSLPILGLHFAGRVMTANYAHSLAAVRDSKILAQDAIGRLNWV